MNRRRRYLWLLLSITLICAATQAVGAADQPQVAYEFLAELATIREVPGFPPKLFQPAKEPSRIEIAFFLYRLDQSLAETAGGQDLDLRQTLSQVWRTANPGADPLQAVAWAEEATTKYRRLLIEYHREMGALGFRLRPDAYPYWCRGNDDVLGD